MKFGDILIYGLAAYGAYFLAKKLMKSDKKPVVKKTPNTQPVRVQVTPLYVDYPQQSFDINETQFDVADWVQS
jgi:hypothetical protein